MTNYIGFRVEVASRIAGGKAEKLIKRFNKKGRSRVFDLFINGKITVERIDEMLIARGAENNNKKNTPNVNFAIMIPIDECDTDRIVQIVNVLGNGRLIRERTKTFVDGQSAINKIPEFHGIIDAFKDLDKLMPGLINASWYYAPEAIYDK